MLSDISSAMNTFFTILAGIGSITILFLSITLLMKYKKNGSKAVRFLGLAFLFFCFGIITALPIYFLPGEALHIKKLFYAIAKTITLIALNWFFNFTFEIFYPNPDAKKKIRSWKLFFFISCFTLVLINYPIEIVYFLEHAENLKPPIFSVILDVIMGIPFLVLYTFAMRVSKKSDVRKEQVAIQYIAISSLLQSIFFFAWAINEFIAAPNMWTLPQWISVLTASVLFYIGVARPKRIFSRYE